MSVVGQKNALIEFCWIFFPAEKKQLVFNTSVSCDGKLESRDLLSFWWESWSTLLEIRWPKSWTHNYTVSPDL
jgi:hypothetical protein